MPHIDAYSFGRIVIDGESYTQDVIVRPDRVVPHWWRREGHSLHPDDLDKAVEALPEVFIMGRGDSGVLKIPDSTRHWLEEQGIELIESPTPEAVRKYNELSGNRRVAAGFHLTC